MMRNEVNTKNELETFTVRYEHRVTVEHNGGDWYGTDVIFKVGEVLKKTKGPGKYKYYGKDLAHGAGVDIPAEKVGVFKITRLVTETEELVD